MTEEVQITFLGTAAAPPQLERKQSSMALCFKNNTILIDMGEGIQTQLLRYKIKTSKNLIILLTHLHSDHTQGLVGFLSTRNLLELRNPITLIGPPGTIEFIYLLNLTFKLFPDYNIRIIETEGEVVLNNDDFCIESFPTDHGLPSFGYKIVVHPPTIGSFNVEKAKQLNIPKGPLWQKLQNGSPIELNGKKIQPSAVLEPNPKKPISVVFSGDTRYSDVLVDKSQDVDLLVHDATYPPNESERAKLYYHSTSNQAAKTAKLANAKQLVLTHLSELHKNLDKSLKEAQDIFENTLLGYDGLTLSLDYNE